jgi:inosose dehydratase
MTTTDPSVHLLLDTGHATFAVADPEMLASRCRSRISHVHAKDVRHDVMERARAERMSFFMLLSRGIHSGPSRIRRRRIP